MTTIENTQAIANQLERGPLTGTDSFSGGTMDNRGRLAILKARLAGVTDPDELRAISRAAKAQVEASRKAILRRAALQVEKSVVRRDTLIREAVGEGLSYRQVAEITGLSFGRIGQIARERGEDQ